MNRYLVTSKIRVVLGVDGKSEKEAHKTAMAELKDLVTQLNQSEIVGLGAKFEVSDFDTNAEELPF